jgi:hypothetical protein
MRAAYVAAFIGAVLALIVKRLLAPRLFKLKDLPGVWGFIGIAILEILIMFPAFTIANEFSPSTQTIAVLLVAYFIYLLPAVPLNIYLTRMATARIAKAFLFAIIFPVSLVVSSALLFLPLYTMFGG